MEEFFLPTLHAFAMGNEFTGSNGMFRFRIIPNVVKLNQKEVDMQNSSIDAMYWHGLFCFEKSEIEGKETFPMSEEGRIQMRDWLISNI